MKPASDLDAMGELELFLRAHYPLIYAASVEEARFVAELERICSKMGRPLWLHAISEGLWNIGYTHRGEYWPDSRPEGARRDLQDPIELLTHLKRRSDRGGVYLLLDFHEAMGDAMVRRLLRDIAPRFRQSRANLVILAPTVRIPADLEHDFGLVDFPLPQDRDLEAHLAGAVAALQKRGLTVQLDQGQRERLVSAGRGLTIAEFENGLATAVIRHGAVTPGIVDAMLDQKKQLIRKSGILEFFPSTETLEQVGGLEVLKRWLVQRREAFTDRARDFGLPPPKGVLLLGVQGSGKSLTAKACAGLWKFPLLRLDTGALFSTQVGSSEANARRAIRTAESLAPCILWIDEIEKALAGLESSGASDAGTAARVFATLATWLQEKTAPVFVIATANSADALPPEMLRKGRWDEVFFVDLPGENERRAVFDIHLRKRRRDPRKFDLARLARGCSGFSGAEIEQAVVAGLYDAFEASRPLTTADIQRNLEAQVPVSATLAEPIQALRTWARTRARWASQGHLQDERQQWQPRELRPV